MEKKQIPHFFGFIRFHPCFTPAHLGKVAQLPRLGSEEHASQGLLLGAVPGRAGAFLNAIDGEQNFNYDWFMILGTIGQW